MKNLFRNAWLVVGLSALITACGDGNPAPKPPEVVIPATTKVLGKTAQAALETIQPNALTFAGTQAISTGDVVVSAPTSNAKDGFLRKVKSVKIENGKTILETEPATLRDAIRKGSLKTTKELLDSDVEAVNLTSGVQYVRQSPTSRLPRGNPTFQFSKVLYDKDGNDTTKNDQVILSGFLDLKTSVNFDWDIDFLPPDFDFLAKATFTETSNLSLKGKEVFAFEKKIRVGEVRFNPIIFSIGPVPVVIRPIVQLDIGIRGSVGGEVDISVTQKLVVEAGAEYNEEWRGISNISNTFTIDSSKITANLNATVFADVTLELQLYEAVGLFIRPELFVAFDAQFPRKPLWKLDGGLGIDVGIKIDKWGIDKTYDTRVFETRFPIAQSQNSAPTVDFNLFTTADLNRPVFISADGNDPEDGLNLSYTWTSSLASDGVLGTGKTIFIPFSTTGSRIISVIVKDSDGLTASQSKTINITNSAPSIGVSEPNNTSVIYKALNYTLQASTTDVNEPNNFLDCSRVTWTSSVASDAFPKTGCEINAVFSSVGVRTVTILATDPQGLSNTQTVDVNVLPTPANQPPNPVTIDSPKATFDLPLAQGIVQLAGSALDPELKAVTFEWFAARQDVNASGQAISDFSPRIKLTPDAKGAVNLFTVFGLVCGGYNINIRITLVASDPEFNTQPSSVTLQHITCVN